MKCTFWAAPLLCVGLAGCLHFGPGGFKAKEEVEKEKDLDIGTIGDVTEVGSVDPWQISGVGLVTGLAGTGHSPKGEFRTMLEQQLLKQKEERVKELLDDPRNALVMVTASIRAGCRKGEALDIEITLPPGSKTTSLEGGTLRETVLRNYDSARRVKSSLGTDTGGDRLLEGFVLARARGKLQVGLGSEDEPGEERRARVLQGGVSLVDRPLEMRMKKNDEKAARVAAIVAGRINFMFQDDPRKRELVLRDRGLFVLDDVTKQLNKKKNGLEASDMARAISKEKIHVLLPFAYRYNPERYLLVVRNMPLREDPQTSGPYRRRLATMLFDPQDTVRAALRLEALGTDSAAILKSGLTHEHALVRFAAAEALLYLGNTSGVDELARLAQAHSVLRMRCLTALASSEHAMCREKLAGLLSSPDADLQCGAAWALRLDALGRPDAPRDPYLRSEPINGVFWLHKPSPVSAPLVSVSTKGRSEVALFGGDIFLQPPVRLCAGKEFTVVIDPGDDRCTISRISARVGERRLQSTLKLEDVLRGLVELGAGFRDIQDFLHKLDARGSLPCEVRFDLMPEHVRLEDLVKDGRELGKGAGGR